MTIIFFFIREFEIKIFPLCFLRSPVLEKSNVLYTALTASAIEDDGPSIPSYEDIILTSCEKVDLEWLN